eukprot:CAMPEP_0118946182 /NCGR_PEP_ID=MMETSP1169-20130426/43751_1 /TAXON_ID=36882 /ORGANISM="Pyramimonas obovata, Strain CCMP722" /LENGTH=90 /DNA_ID=CAMNT_0006892089 /DNA_START=74 /DNA_END=343 /DNA_ORIENTATION=+
MVHYIVVGGGVAGVCCVEELCRSCPNDLITLVTATDYIKGVDKVVHVTKNLEEFEVVERQATSFSFPNLKMVKAHVESLDSASKCLRTSI